MNENTSTCVKCGYTLAQHDYVHGARGNCGNFVDAGPFFDDRPLLDMNDITQLSTLYSNAIARAEKAEEALRRERLTISGLQRAHVQRQEEWCPDQKPDLSFRGNELGGECGEAQNVIKKLERERHGWRGSRDTVEHLGEELADVIHCAILCAITAGIDLEPAVTAKFNSTSEKNGLSTFLSTPPPPVRETP